MLKEELALLMPGLWPQLCRVGLSHGIHDKSLLEAPSPGSGRAGPTAGGDVVPRIPGLQPTAPLIAGAGQFEQMIRKDASWLRTEPSASRNPAELLHTIRTRLTL